MVRPRKKRTAEKDEHAHERKSRTESGLTEGGRGVLVIGVPLWTGGGGRQIFVVGQHFKFGPDRYTFASGRSSILDIPQPTIVCLSSQISSWVKDVWRSGNHSTPTDRTTGDSSS